MDAANKKTRKDVPPTDTTTKSNLPCRSNQPSPNATTPASRSNTSVRPPPVYSSILSTAVLSPRPAVVPSTLLTPTGQNAVDPLASSPVVSDRQASLSPSESSDPDSLDVENDAPHSFLAPHNTSILAHDPANDDQVFECRIDKGREPMGMTLSFRTRRVCVQDVVQGSLAEKAGIKVGDFVVAINGNYLDGLSFQRVLKALKAHAMGKLVLKIRRNDDTSSTTSTKRPACASNKTVKRQKTEETTASTSTTSRVTSATPAVVAPPPSTQNLTPPSRLTGSTDTTAHSSKTSARSTIQRNVGIRASTSTSHPSTTRSTRTVTTATSAVVTSRLPNSHKSNQSRETIDLTDSTSDDRPTTSLPTTAITLPPSRPSTTAHTATTLPTSTVAFRTSQPTSYICPPASRPTTAIPPASSRVRPAASTLSGTEHPPTSLSSDTVLPSTSIGGSVSTAPERVETKASATMDTATHTLCAIREKFEKQIELLKQDLAAAEARAIAHHEHFERTSKSLQSDFFTTVGNLCNMYRTLSNDSASGMIQRELTNAKVQSCRDRAKVQWMVNRDFRHGPIEARRIQRELVAAFKRTLRNVDWNACVQASNERHMPFAINVESVREAAFRVLFQRPMAAGDINVAGQEQWYGNMNGQTMTEILEWSLNGYVTEKGVERQIHLVTGNTLRLLYDREMERLNLQGTFVIH